MAVATRLKPEERKKVPTSSKGREGVFTATGMATSKMAARKDAKPTS